jgi:hypothetical protein
LQRSRAERMNMEKKSPLFSIHITIVEHSLYGAKLVMTLTILSKTR